MTAAFDPAFGEAWTAPQCIGALALPGTCLLLAEQADRVVAFAILRTVFDEAELMLVAVDPSLQKQGIGRALLQQVFAASADRSASRLHVEVREDNAAIHFYSMLGFIEIGRRRNYYKRIDGKNNDAITLCRIISEADQILY
jgi:ribosomal-protein-alanine N-acetyltransferase